MDDRKGIYSNHSNSTVEDIVWMTVRVYSNHSNSRGQCDVDDSKGLQ